MFFGFMESQDFKLVVGDDHYLYLSSPYTHKDPSVVQERFRLTELVCAKLLETNYLVFSPIVHCHAIAEKYHLPTDADYWLRYDEACLKRCTHMVILMLDGWEVSKGIKLEIGIARKYKIPVIHLKLNGESYSGYEPTTR